MYCPECGAEVDESHSFCPHCSSSLDSGPTLIDRIGTRGLLAILVIGAIGALAVAGPLNPTGQVVAEGTADATTDATFEVRNPAGNPLSNVTVDLDSGDSCTTDETGTCSISTTPDKYEITLSGQGVQHAEVEDIGSGTVTLDYTVQRELLAQIEVDDALTSDPVEGATVYFDGSRVGTTSADGSYTVDDIEAGSHTVRVTYNSVEETRQVSVSLDNTNFALEMEVPRDIELTLTDTETGKPVSEEQVYLDGSQQGYTSTAGTITLENVMPGSHTVSLQNVNPTPSTNIDVGADTDVSASVDMPNPTFKISAHPETGLLDSIGDVKISLDIYNNGNAPSQDTTALVLDYRVKNDELVRVDSDIIDLSPRSIPIGRKATGTSEGLDNNVLQEEYFVILVFDGSTYFPEDAATTDVSLEKNWVEERVTDITNWCADDPDQCAEISGTLAGEFAGAFAGSLG